MPRPVELVRVALTPSGDTLASLGEEAVLMADCCATPGYAVRACRPTGLRVVKMSQDTQCGRHPPPQHTPNKKTKKIKHNTIQTKRKHHITL